MEMLYAPWREKYTADATHGPQGKDDAPSSICVFCQHLQNKNDKTSFILGRYKRCYVVLNRYPYNGGHLLVLPFEHKSQLSELSSETRNELMELISQSTSILQEELDAKGINIGLNMGKAAGAGIPSHLHFHVLPRWHGDTNFLPTLGNVKPVSVDLETVYKKLKPRFAHLK